MKIKYSAIIIFSVSMYSCATIFDGSRQSILINTYPAQAKVSHNGIELGTTPVIVKIKRKDNAPLILSSEGYETKEITLTKKFNPSSIYNYINPFGWYLDYLTGSIHRYKEIACIHNLVAKNEVKVVEHLESLDSVKIPEDILIWNANQKLIFENFEGEIGKKDKLFAAVTSSSITCQYVLNDSSAIVRISTCFYKKNSFFTSKKIDRKNLLIHEQQHFDITEIISRNIRRELTHHKFRRETFEKDLNKIVFNSHQALDSMQAQYDNFVYNPRDKAFEGNRQKKWNKMVAMGLDSLKSFAESDINVLF